MTPLSRATSLPENLDTIHDIQFELPFEHSPFRTMCKSFVDQIVVDEVILQPYKPIRPSVELDSDQQALQEFDKLQDLVLAIDQVIHQAYIQ